MSDYLWDKKGEPDPEVERLERLLAPLAHRPSPLSLPTPPLPTPTRRRARYVPLALVAAAAAALVALLIARPWRPRDGAPTATARSTLPMPTPAMPTPSPSLARASWRATVSGAGARADGHAIAGDTAVAVGAWIDTGAGRVTLRVADIGTVALEPGTRARIAASSPAQQKLELDHGALAAAIDAPPRVFVVATRRLVVTDLGCAFTLAVDEAGRGRLVVTAGSVAVSSGAGGEIVVPAGAQSDLAATSAGAPYPSGSPAPQPRDASAHRPTGKRPHPSAHVKPPTSRPSHTIAAPPRHTVAPAHPSAPARLTHDPLKDLERSGE